MPHRAARFTVADVLRDHAPRLRLGEDQRRVVAHLTSCRTGRLGGHVAVCTSCGAEHFAYHSCRDRHCPTCGHLDQLLWAEAQRPNLLPVPYFHVVFTVPACLRPFFVHAGRRAAIEALFDTVASTLLDVAERNLHARVGVLAVLHTWTQRLDQHPHLHCLVTGGGLDAGRWVHRSRYLVRSTRLALVFRARLLEALRALVDVKQLDAGPHPSRPLLARAQHEDWVVDVRRSLHGPQQIIDYFARYSRRIALSNHRIVDYDGRTVTFTWRDRAHGNRVRTRTVDAERFCRLFLQHVLPKRLVRIRRYGLLANRCRQDELARARDALGAVPPASVQAETRAQACLRVFGIKPTTCPSCGADTLVTRTTWTPRQAALYLGAASAHGPPP